LRKVLPKVLIYMHVKSIFDDIQDFDNLYAYKNTYKKHKLIIE